MNNLKKLIPAICMLLMTATMLSTASFAWFSMNRTVTVTGMQIKAEAPGSLVISDTNTFEKGKTALTFTAGTYRIIPATKYQSEFCDNTDAHNTLSAPASNLATVANGGDVEPTNGLAKAEKTLYYTAADTAATASTAGYYFDYILYLAAEGEEDITSGTLKIAVDKIETFAEPALKATAVGILYGNDTAFTGDIIYLKDGVEKQDIKTLSDTVKIPKGASGTVAGAVKITLRVFVDGAALDADSTTFVKNATVVNLNNTVSFGVKFIIE